MINVQPVILAGGSGSRLWPVSRRALPKQLLRLIGNKTMLQLTLERVKNLDAVYPPIIVVGEEHRFTTWRQLSALDLFAEVEVLLEPLGKSTGPAICGAVEFIRKNVAPDAVALVLPSDHLIDRECEFVQAVKNAVDLARKERIVTFGIKPERAETGYGYIERGEGDKVLSFKEKPDMQCAREYLSRSDFYWNSGMFVFRVDTFQREMKIHAPGMSDHMAEAIENGRQDGNFFRFDARSMTGVDDISIDNALMEKTRSAMVLPVDLGWRDVGSWYALWHELEKNGDGNVLQGDVMASATRNSLVVAEDKLVAVVGLENMLVVETGDALLVSTMVSSQDVKGIVERLKAENREEWCNHRFFSRPWGSYTILEKREKSVVRKIVINPGMKLSLQKHCHRDVHLVVVSGTAKLTCGEDVVLLHENQSKRIPSGVAHRLENPGILKLEIIEVHSGERLREDDIDGGDSDGSAKGD